MTKVRYKIRKEQLERVVENFVMESAMIEKNAATKHKMKMGGEQSDEMGEGMKDAPETKSMKKSQAPEAKKHVTAKGGQSSDAGEGMKMASVKDVKKPQAPEAKKHMK